MLKLQFLGAAGQVTGSKYFLHTSTSRGMLVDCGLFQGGRKLREMNWTNLAISPGNIGHILITHAHLDHIGFLPRLVKRGYRNPIFATEATIEIAGYVLRDSAHLQEEDAKHANKHGYARHSPALPLYTSEDAEEALKLFQRIDRGNKKLIQDNVSATYYNAGHILGSCFVNIEKKYDDRDPITVLFSGDLGRRKPIYLKPKDPAPAADYIICESTYGDRLHKDISALDELKAVIMEAINTSSVLLIPAFAVDRSQELLFCLNALMRDGEIPDTLPVYVDSPMAAGVTDIYDKFSEEHIFTQEELNEPDKNPIRFKSLKVITTPEQSKHLNDINGPAVIISASGMATGGRIMHHLLHRLANLDTIVLFTGYQAEETLGRVLIEGNTHVHIMGTQVQVRARIRKLNSYSGHGDQSELLDWLKSSPRAPKAVFLTHGEDSARKIFKEKIESELGWKVILPHLGEIFDLEAQSL